MLYVHYIPRVFDNQQIEGNFATNTLTISKARFQNVISIAIRTTKRLSTFESTLGYRVHRGKIESKVLGQR